VVSEIFWKNDDIDLDFLVKEASKANAELEIYMRELVAHSSGFENNEFKEFSASRSHGIGVRVIINNKLGFAYTNVFHNKNLRRILKYAIKTAKLSENNSFVQFAPKAKFATSNFLDGKIMGITPEYILNEAKVMLNSALELLEGQSLDAKLSGGISRVLVKKRIFNTNGLDVEYTKSYFEKYLYGTTVNVPSLGCEVSEQLGKGLGKSAEKLALEFVNLIKTSLKPKKMDKVRGEILFYPKAFSSILLNTLGEALSAENVGRQKSFLTNKLGTQIAADNLNLVDGINFDFLPSSKPFDDEGTMIRETEVIKNGTLTSYLYDIEWGNRLRSESTGNAVREYSSLPSIGVKCLHLPPTTSTPLISQIEKGYFIKSVAGAHTANSLTGDFGVVVTAGYIIENGEVTCGIYGPLLTGNILDLLTSFRASDRELVPIEYGPGESTYLGNILIELPSSKKEA